MSVRYFCDCCGNEITDANRIESDKGRLFGILRSKVKGQTEPLQVEVTTALGSTWNAGHFCKYCVIDAVNSKDDRPMPATVPEHKLRESETRYNNLLLDLQRVMNDEPTLCNFPEVEQLHARIAGVAACGNTPYDEGPFSIADGVPGTPNDQQEQPR